MGMYNEVFKRCPYCGGRGVMQISQIVLGFGEFNLDDPEDIASRLSQDDVCELIRMVKEENRFRCDKCDETFEIGEDETHDEKVKMLKKLLR